MSYDILLTNETRVKVERVIMHLGIDPSCKGYYYLIDIISLYLSGYSLNHNILRVYKEVADRHNAKYTAVERAIRHVIQKGFNFIVSQEIDFGFTEDGNLPNRQFIFSVVRHIKLCDMEHRPYFQEKR